MQHASAGDLQWKRGKPRAAQAAAAANEGIRRDAAVRPASWNNAQDTSSAENGRTVGRATMKSLLIHPAEPDDAVRPAQLQQPAAAGGASAEPPRSQFDAALEELRRSSPAQPGGQLDLPAADTNRTLEFQPTPLPAEQDASQPGATVRQPGESLVPQPADERPTPFDADADARGAGRQSSEEWCRQGLAALQSSKLADVDLDITVAGTAGEDFPYECPLDEGALHAGRAWPDTVFMWKASALCHKPLYFEDEGMERYGHSWGPCCDPIVAGVHFFTKLPVLPYCMGVEPPCECIYALGHYRPGSCAPYLIDPVPISARGALFQAGAVVGAAAILP